MSIPFITPTRPTSLFEEDIRPKLAKQAQFIADQALSQGADEAEVFFSQGSELSAKVRLGKPELLQEASHQSMSLRVFYDHKMAITSTSDLSQTGIQSMVQKAISLCKLSESDPFHELPSEQEFAKGPFPELHLWDQDALSISAHEAIEQAKEAEAAALTFSPLIQNSEGASYDRAVHGSALACLSKKGACFVGSNRATYQSLQVEVLCEDTGGKKRNGSYFTGHRFANKLLPPTFVGEEAARRTLAQKGAKPIESQSLPIIFSQEAARGILRLFASVVAGNSIYRQSSYLCGKEGQMIASPFISIIDDPFLLQGPGSRPFDGEGLPSRTNVIVDHGRLNTYLLDTYSAKKLNRVSNGCAGRSGGSPYVGTSNFIFQPGSLQEQELLQDVPRGFYVTDMMGFGFNPVTGDFSKGASGFLIEKGQKTVPISEVTISAHFQDLFYRIDAIANQLDQRSAMMAPAFRVSHMMIAGK